MLSSQTDKFDYLVSIGSGVLCGALDILWVGEFNLERGRGIASDKIDGFVTKTSKMLGCKNDDLESAVKFLEKKFPIRAKEILLTSVVVFNIICVTLPTIPLLLD